MYTSLNVLSNACSSNVSTTGLGLLTVAPYLSEVLLPYLQAIYLRSVGFLSSYPTLLPSGLCYADYGTGAFYRWLGMLSICEFSLLVLLARRYVLLFGLKCLAAEAARAGCNFEEAV